MKTILVVDDYPDARLLLSYVIEDAGFRVIHAETGPQAIAMAREHAPVAIVMDIHLPGMSGIEATQRLRSDPALAHIPIVAYTLSSQRLPVDESRLFDAVYTKPSSPDALIETLRRLARDKPDV